MEEHWLLIGILFHHYGKLVEINMQKFVVVRMYSLILEEPKIFAPFINDCLISIVACVRYLEEYICLILAVKFNRPCG